MKRRRWITTLLFIAFPAHFSLATELHGLNSRPGNTTLRLPAQPPVTSFMLTNAFGALTFVDPVAVVSPPDESNRVFVVEQAGRIAVITNLTAPTRTVFLDISARIVGGVPADERGLLGLAFHPGYATNGFFFIYYSLNTTTAAGTGLHEQLSRFSVSSEDPNAANTNSELPLLTMYDEAPNHNGGDLHFGPDGLLYVSLGDEGDANDSLNNSQRLDKDFWSSLLRLDVDEPFRSDSLMPNPHPANTNAADGLIHYRVPVDNPFVGAASYQGAALDPARVRAEIYALGLRNPWRFSFDPATGRLYCGDVGQGAWEEIDVITRGGNYGWAVLEGNAPGPKVAPPGFTSRAPILVYPHGFGTDQGNSVTGGVVYRGSRLPALNGAYLFADYVAGNVWSLRFDGSTVTGWTYLLVNPGISAFGIDPANGDVLVADQAEDTIQRLVSVSTTGGGAPLPPTLAETGAFADLASLQPATGLAPYDVNVPFWSDGAIKSRWFYIPTNYNVIFQPQNPWLFTTGSVWVKHFELELTKGVASSRRRIETRFLVRGLNVGQGDVYGVTYRWGDSLTNAELVPEEGADEPFVIDTGGGILRTQIWHYPGRGECLQCHTRVAGWVLGFNTAQLNRDFDYGDVVENQLLALSHAGYFTRPITNIYAWRFLTASTDETVSLEQRVRSYLAVNCAQCHQLGGSGASSFDARFIISLVNSSLVNGRLNDNGGDPAARLVVPGSLDHSMIWQRISRRGAGQMPPLASTVPDTQAVALLSRWITNDLPRYQTFPQWQLSRFGSTNAPGTGANLDPDNDGANNFTEYLAGTDPTDRADAWRIELIRDGSNLELRVPHPANRRVEVQWTTDLGNPAGWLFLNDPENRPVFPASNGVSRLFDVLGAGKRYRARLFEP